MKTESEQIIALLKLQSFFIIFYYYKFIDAEKREKMEKLFGEELTWLAPCVVYYL